MSKFEKIEIESREQWLKLREQDVTASVIGALLGVHEYETAYSLYQKKAGLVPANGPDTAVLKRGRLMEPVALRLIQEQRPEWSCVAPNAYFREPAVRLGATPDLIAFDAERRRGVIQIKTVAANVISKWRDYESSEFRPPLWIAVQAIVEAYLTESDWAAVAALVVGHSLDLTIVPVPIHAGIIEKARYATLEFWQRIADGNPPPPHYGRDGEAIAKLWVGKENKDEEIDLTSDNVLPMLCAEHAEISKRIAIDEKRHKEIKAEILAKMGTAAVARFQGGRITAKTIHRKAYEVKASSYRSPRIKFDKEDDDE